MPRPGPAHEPGPDTDPGPGQDWGRGSARPAVLAGVLIVALGVVLAVVVTGNATSHHDRHDHDAAPADTTSDFRADDTGTVVLDGVSGRIQVTADPDAHAVTGSYHRPGGGSAALHGTTADDPVSGGRALTLRCEDGSGDSQPCAGDLVLTVPEHTGLRLRQTSGVAVLDGLGGDVSLDASSLQLTTRDLHSSHADVRVVSGSADLGFAAAPADLDLHASSASVAVRLPRTDDGYAVTTTAASADVQVLVPRDPAAGHRVALTVTSGSLSVQNA